VESGPLVRSSYHAWEQVQAAGVWTRCQVPGARYQVPDTAVPGTRHLQRATSSEQPV